MNKAVTTNEKKKKKTMEVKASDYKCVVCGKQAEVWYPIIDPDIPPHPYCRECVTIEHQQMLRKLFRRDDKDSNN